MDLYSSLKDQIIVVLGASSGIGRSISIALSELGARVVLVARSQERLQATLDNMHNKSNHLIKVYDLGNASNILNLFKEIVAECGSNVNGLVCSAGVHHFTPLRSMSDRSLQEMWQTNVNSAIHAIAAFSNKLISAPGSSIVLLSSASAIVGEKAVVGYSATKGAINSIVKSTAVELASRKIRVNSVVPGIVETEMSKGISASMSVEQYEEIKNKHLLGIGQPEDVAQSVVFLLSSASRWITGTSLVVDGGYSL